MNRDDIYAMAEEAGIRLASQSDPIDHRNVYLHELERFAALVAEENDKKWQALIASIDEYAAACNKGIELSGKLSLAAIDVAVTVEREACARVCDGDGVRQMSGDECAAAIRARGEV